MPIIVPPEPMPATIQLTLLRSAKISFAVCIKCAAGFAGFVNCDGIKAWP